MQHLSPWYGIPFPPQEDCSCPCFACPVCPIVNYILVTSYLTTFCILYMRVSMRWFGSQCPLALNLPIIYIGYLYTTSFPS